MIVIKLIGGLGNQLFQYAAAKSLANKINTELVVDIRDLTKYKLHKYGAFNRLNINIKFLSKLQVQWSKLLLKIYKKLKLKKIYLEDGLNFNPDFFSIKNNTYLEGYFQSEKYFSSMVNDLRDEFKPRYPLSDKNLDFLNKINNSNGVALHVRRGDYVSDLNTLNIHGVCCQDYYHSAINLVIEKISNPFFYIFSDEVDWVKKNISLPNEVEFVTGNIENPEIDLFLMQNCKHFILANSSFSWWGAWLSENEKKLVIVPTPWFDSNIYNSQDICPPEWIKLQKNHHTP